jgi:hypothetical protein
MIDDDVKTSERFVACLKKRKNINYFYHAKVSSTRNYALKNIVRASEIVADITHEHDIVSIVDLDDRLTPGAINRVHEMYISNPLLGLTYGSYAPSSGKKKRNCGKYPDGCDFRKHRWLGSHLLTFRYGLFRYLVENCEETMLLAGGRWPKYAYDFAITFSLMELLGHDRIEHIPDVLYIYNDQSPHNCHKIARKAQIAEANWYRSQEPLKRLDTLPW